MVLLFGLNVFLRIGWLVLPIINGFLFVAETLWYALRLLEAYLRCAGFNS